MKRGIKKGEVRTTFRKNSAKRKMDILIVRANSADSAEIENTARVRMMMVKMRAERGWSLKEVAEKIGISKTEYENWESPRRDISIRKLARFANAMGAMMQIEIWPEMDGNVLKNQDAVQANRQSASSSNGDTAT